MTQRNSVKIRLMIHRDAVRYFAFLILALAVPQNAQAQLGGSFGFRSLTGDETVNANSERRGYEARLFYGRDAWGNLGWRAEFAGSQMQYQRDDGGGRFQVSENSLELSALLKARPSGGVLHGVYAVAGPTMSWRGVCGSFGQNTTACDEGDKSSLGYALGVGFQSPLTPRRDYTLEVRYYDGVVAGAGSPMLSLSFGLVVARR